MQISMPYMPITLNTGFKVWPSADVDTLFSLWVILASMKAHPYSCPNSLVLPPAGSAETEHLRAIEFLTMEVPFLGQDMKGTWIPKPGGWTSFNTCLLE